MIRVFWVGLGGFIGAVSRYLVSGWVQSVTSGRFPYGTMTVNVLGSFTLGLLAVIMVEQGSVNLETQLLLMTGLLGSFTTFSTFSYESMNLFRDGLYFAFLGNTLGNLLFCLLGVTIGIFLGKVVT